MYPLEPLTGVGIESCLPLVGRWKGLYGDQPVEEIWHEPVLGEMMGCFRWVKEGKVWLYEFCQLAQREGGIVLRIRHFGEGFVAWEDKETPKTFDLVQVTAEQAIFRQRHDSAVVWTIYDWSREGRLRVWFEREDKPHHVDSVFEYSRT